ncbi:hypothetical protein BMF77_02123 [Dolichospermum sp. UHCC 0315A]|jgi:putative transposase|uniref:Uncharacterized protein n=1 Tax=Dolichospermum flos-aquae CCAP 1403/13F TaxID=315271 RepID=A0A6H2BTB7_DOLFA|nr:MULTISPECIES: hypothetical protein [Dolichospermum]QEI41532.1 hypothetical protein BMF77_02123 [Dolichospermum sp. UHCC 0315A]QJB42832.1 hypothetical protein HGD76_07085 [Dolichospermum flos-aquae CCAP 1403/13F]
MSAKAKKGDALSLSKGKRKKQKAGLNKSILDVGMGMIMLNPDNSQHITEI